jgi:hypothetical protein
MSLFRIINVYSTFMYTTSMDCTYSTTEQYQVELLKAFQVSHYDELGTKMTDLYQIVQGESTLTTLLNKVIEVYSWANPEHAFFLLFSYDYFKYTHLYIVDLLEKRESSSYENLLSELK